MEREVIENSQKVMAEHVREFVRGQVATWQRLPHWYLESQGRRGWLDDCTPFTHGIWSISHPYDPPWIVVECATGQLLTHAGSGWKRTTDEELVALLYKGSDDRFDAKKQLKSLKATAKMSRPSWFTVKQWEEENEERRQLWRRNYKVREQHTLPAKPIELRFNYP